MTRLFLIYFVVYLLITVKIAIVRSQSQCEFVSDLLVSYDENWQVEDENYTTRITGCIKNTSFEIEKVEVIAIYCNNENLPAIERDFITNMAHLKYIYVGNCYLQTIERCAFYNLPKIHKININANLLKKISIGVFNELPNLEILYLFRNQISQVDDCAFSNLPNLKHLSLSENRLENIRKEWFINTTNIEDFRMFLNRLKTVPVAMFHGWKKLRELDLSGNYISRLDGPLLKDNSPIMGAVSLHRNRLRTLPMGAFSESGYIGFILISGNLLNYLPDDLLNDVNVGEISIFANPFTCPCYDKITKAFYKRGVTVNRANKATNVACTNADVPVCGNSRNSTNVCVEVVDKELTERIITRMKELHYDTIIDYLGQQCSTFDYSDD